MPLTDEHRAAQQTLNRMRSAAVLSLGDTLTIEGVRPRLVWWKRALVAVGAMKEPPAAPLTVFRVTAATEGPAYDVAQAKYDADAGRF